MTGLTQNITKNSVIVTWQPPRTPNGIITAYTTYLNATTVRLFRRPGTNVTMYNVTTQSREITTHVMQVVLTGFYGNVTYALCVAARTSVGYGPCSRNLVFTTSKFVDATRNCPNSQLPHPTLLPPPPNCPTPLTPSCPQPHP